MPVVVGAVLAVGARKMAKEKAIVSRCAPSSCGDVLRLYLPRLLPGITAALRFFPLIQRRRLSALEELSGMEVLCSDKTGTLTLNRLTLDKAGAWAGARLGLSGPARGHVGAECALQFKPHSHACIFANRVRRHPDLGRLHCG